MSALLLAFSVPAERFGTAFPLGLALLALVGLVAFVIRESRYPEPIIRPSLFRNLDFAVMNAASIAVHLAAFSVLLLVPYYLVRIAGVDVAVGGIVLAFGAGGMVVGSWLAGRLAARTKVGRLALAGVALGIALTLSCAPALATSLFDETERTRALGAYAAITAAGSAIGPLVGGFLVERWDWNAVFWFRAPSCSSSG